MGNICGRGIKPRGAPVQLPAPHTNEPIFALCGASGYQVATSGEDRCLCLWDAMDGAMMQRWDHVHRKPVNRVAYMATGRLLATGSRDGNIRLWRHGAGPQHVSELCMHRISIGGLATLDESRWLMSGSRDYTVRLWDVSASQQVGEASISRNVVTSMRRVPGEAAVAQTSEDLHIYVWDARALKKPAQALHGFSNIPQCVDCSMDGRLLVTSHNGFGGNGCEVLVWDRRQGRVFQTLCGHTESVNACVFVPVATQGASGMSTPLVASGSKDGTLRLWNVDSAACICTESLPGSQCTALDLLSRETGGSSDDAARGLKTPGWKRPFQRLLCAATLEGCVSTWGVQSQPLASGMLQLVACSLP